LRGHGFLWDFISRIDFKSILSELERTFSTCCAPPIVAEPSRAGHKASNLVNDVIFNSSVQELSCNTFLVVRHFPADLLSRSRCRDGLLGGNDSLEILHGDSRDPNAGFGARVETRQFPKEDFGLHNGISSLINNRRQAS